MKMNLLNCVLLLVFVSSLSSCGIGSQMPTMKEEIVELNNTKWKLEKPKELEATLSINEDTSVMSGYNGCNQYEGSVTMKNYRIEVGSFMMTERFCDDIDSKDDKFMHLLSKVTDYRIVGKRLYLNRGSQNLLQFEQSDKAN